MRRASARSKTNAKACAKGSMDERDLGRDPKRQTTDSFGNFEDIFSEPVAPATGEADWLIDNCLCNFCGKHNHTRKMAEDAI